MLQGYRPIARNEVSAVPQMFATGFSQGAAAWSGGSQAGIAMAAGGREAEMQPASLEHARLRNQALAVDTEYARRTLDTRVEMLDLQVARMNQNYASAAIDSYGSYIDEGASFLSGADSLTGRSTATGGATVTSGGVVMPAPSYEAGPSDLPDFEGGGGAVTGHSLFPAL